MRPTLSLAHAAQQHRRLHAHIACMQCPMRIWAPRAVLCQPVPVRRAGTMATAAHQSTRGGGGECKCTRAAKTRCSVPCRKAEPMLRCSHGAHSLLAERPSMLWPTPGENSNTLAHTRYRCESCDHHLRRPMTPDPRLPRAELASQPVQVRVQRSSRCRCNASAHGPLQSAPSSISPAAHHTTCPLHAADP